MVVRKNMLNLYGILHVKLKFGGHYIELKVYCDVDLGSNANARRFIIEYAFFFGDGVGF